MKLKDKVAVITGGGQGIGRGTALAMAKEGADIAVVGRTASKLESVVSEITALGRRAIAIEANVRDPVSLARAVDEIVRQLGGIDILSNGAQEYALGTLEELTDEQFIAGYESGPLATFRMIKLVAPIMKKRGGGVIFNFISAAGVRWDMGGYGAYGSHKQAIRVLTRAAASEYGSDNIRALNIAPYAIVPMTEVWAKENPEEAKALFDGIPLGRIGDAEGDVGRAIAMLATDDFKYLTGATIPLEGGQANFD